MLDMSHYQQDNRYGFLPVQAVITEPAVGYGGGLFGLFLHDKGQKVGGRFIPPAMTCARYRFPRSFTIPRSSRSWQIKQMAMTNVMAEGRRGLLRGFHRALRWVEYRFPVFLHIDHHPAFLFSHF